MNHRFINWALFAAVLGVMIGVQQLDARDFETGRQRELRERSFASQACWRFYGAEVVPEHKEDGTLVCRSRRGEELPYEMKKDSSR